MGYYITASVSTENAHVSAEKESVSTEHVRIFMEKLDFSGFSALRVITRYRRILLLSAGRYFRGAATFGLL